MVYPDGLAAVEHPPTDTDGRASGPPVLFVHGSLDRGDSFRRAIRRLGDLWALTYDRRGYQRSRENHRAVHLAGHVADLLALAREAAERRSSEQVVAVGHSFGGDVVLGAALADPGLFGAVAVYEPPMPWLGLRRDGAHRRPLAEDPSVEVERFFRQMVGEASWERLTARGRAERLADGPALVADLGDLRSGTPFDVTGLSVPAVFGRGGSHSREHHRTTVGWLTQHVAGARLFEIPGAGHGAHLSHPDHFAAMTRVALHLAKGPADGPLPMGPGNATNAGGVQPSG